MSRRHRAAWLIPVIALAWCLSPASAQELATSGSATSSAANDSPSDPPPTPTLPGATFRDDPMAVILDAAPAWHFDENSCGPGDATDGHGNQNPGWGADYCNILKSTSGCPAQPPRYGPNTESTTFPTYWSLRYCDGDQSWRALYDVYFVKDTGHRHDWEWAIVRWTAQPGANDTWRRDGVWMERDGSSPYTKWGDLTSTFTNESDINLDNVQNKPRPKLYFGKFHHPVFDTLQTQWFPMTCPPNSIHDFRSNHYRFDAQKNLTMGSVIPADWNYGSADSTPPAFDAGGKFDICHYSGAIKNLKAHLQTCMAIALSVSVLSHYL